MRSFVFMLLSLLMMPGCNCSGGDPLGEFAAAVEFGSQRVDFGEVGIHTRASQELAINNVGTGPLFLESVTINAPFFITTSLDEDAEETIIVAPGESHVLDVGFVPDALGEVDETMTLSFRDIGEGTVDVVGTGVPTPIVLEPESLDFGEVQVGESRTLSFSMTYTGDSRLPVNLVVDGGGFVLASESELALEPGVTVSREIIFAPLQGGSREARLGIETCGQNCGELGVDLSGVGLASRLSAEPLAIDFGSVAVGSNAEASLVLANSGLTALDIEALDSQDPSVTFSALELPLEIQAGESVELTLQFSPDEPMILESNLVIQSTDPLSSRAQVPLRGSAEGAALRLIPGATHFGRLLEGEESTQTFVLRASGTESVEVSALSFGGAQADAFVVENLPALPLLLEAQQSVLFSVRALSQSAPEQSFATLDVQSSAGQSSANLAFDSPTEGCILSAPSAHVNLGFVKLDTEAAASLTVRNIGTADCELLSSGPAEDLDFDEGFASTVSGFPLAPGGNAQVEFSYLAEENGPRSAFFELVTEDETLLVSASAVGVLGSLSPQPERLTFGPKALNCTPQERSMNFVNDGAGAVTVLSVATDRPDIFEVNDRTGIVQPGGSMSMRVTANFETLGTIESFISVETLELGDVQGLLAAETQEAEDESVESFVTPDVRAVDVLFVVDDSGSMFDDQQSLAQNFDQFLEIAQEESDIDFHIAVTSTDVVSQEGLRGRMQGPPTVLTRRTSNLANTFADHVRLGVEGSGLELGLEATRLALSPPLINGSNSGFLREEAALSIIVVSDEDDSAFEGIEQFYPPGVGPVESYITFLEALKGPDTPVVFSFIGNPGSPRYTQMKEHFAGSELSIFEEDWGDELGQLATASFSVTRRFVLQSDIREGEEVTAIVDGVEQSNFTLDGRVVEFDEPLPPGVTVEITYVPQC